MAMYKLGWHGPELPAHGSFWIAATATVAGQVRLGRDVGIWFGAVLRGDDEALEIGNQTNIQDNAVLHADPGFPLIIGRGCTIGHAAIVHGCKIGDNTLVGMGSTVMNGARIGANCIIGANALITEGMIIPDNSLVIGAPAKVVRELDEAAIVRIAESARAYVEKWKLYSSQCIRLDN